MADEVITPTQLAEWLEIEAKATNHNATSKELGEAAFVRANFLRLCLRVQEDEKKIAELNAWFDRWKRDTGCESPRNAGVKIATLERELQIRNYEYRILSDDNERLEADLLRKTEALQDFVTRLDEMEGPLNEVCAIGAIHGLPYNGPNWGEQITRARAALQPVRQGKEKK